MKKLIDSGKTPADLREFMESGRRLGVLRQTDLSSACVSSGLKCWGLFRDLNVIPHLPPTELAVPRLSSFLLPGETLSMYLARPVKGSQLNDCDATLWLILRVRGAPRGLARSTAMSPRG